MLNIKQYNNPNAAVGFYNELYTDDLVFVGPHSSNVLLRCLHMHTHTILTAAAKSSIKGLFLPPPPPLSGIFNDFQRHESLSCTC